jgi:hypothetical protein
LTRETDSEVETRHSFRKRHGPDLRKLFNLVRGLLKNIDDDPSIRLHLEGPRHRADPS